MISVCTELFKQTALCWQTAVDRRFYTAPALALVCVAHSSSSGHKYHTTVLRFSRACRVSRARVRRRTVCAAVSRFCCPRVRSLDKLCHHDHYGCCRVMNTAMPLCKIKNCYAKYACIPSRPLPDPVACYIMYAERIN